MEGSITNLALILYNSVEYIMQGRMPKFSNSLILDKKNLHALKIFSCGTKGHRPKGDNADSLPDGTL